MEELVPAMLVLLLSFWLAASLLLLLLLLFVWKDDVKAEVEGIMLDEIQVRMSRRI